MGHFNSSKEGIKRSYHDCKCGTDNLDNPNPQCVQVTRDKYHLHKLAQQTLDNQTKMLKLDNSFSRLPIDNAFMDRYVPLSDLIHGVKHMTPPEGLHTTCKGCTKYFFETFVILISGTKDLMDDMIQKSCTLLFVVDGGEK